MAPFLLFLAIAAALSVGCDAARGELTWWGIALRIVIVAGAFVGWWIWRGIRA